MYSPTSSHKNDENITVSWSRKEGGADGERENKYIHIVVIAVYCIYFIIYSINLLLCPIYMVNFAVCVDTYV